MYCRQLAAPICKELNELLTNVGKDYYVASNIIRTTRLISSPAEQLIITGAEALCY